MVSCLDFFSFFSLFSSFNLFVFSLCSWKWFHFSWFFFALAHTYICLLLAQHSFCYAIQIFLVEWIFCLLFFALSLSISLFLFLFCVFIVTMRYYVPFFRDSLICCLPWRKRLCAVAFSFRLFKLCSVCIRVIFIDINGPKAYTQLFFLSANNEAVLSGSFIFLLFSLSVHS